MDLTDLFDRQALAFIGDRQLDRSLLGSREFSELSEQDEKLNFGPRPLHLKVPPMNLAIRQQSMISADIL